MKTKTIINSLDGSFKAYFARDISHARNECDASAFKSALEHQQAIAMGKTIVRPISDAQACKLETISGHIRHAFMTRHVTNYRGRLKAIDEIRDYIKNYRRHIEGLA